MANALFERTEDAGRRCRVLLIRWDRAQDGLSSTAARSVEFGYPDRESVRRMVLQLDEIQVNSSAPPDAAPDLIQRPAVAENLQLLANLVPDEELAEELTTGPRLMPGVSGDRRIIRNSPVF